MTAKILDRKMKMRMKMKVMMMVIIFLTDINRYGDDVTKKHAMSSTTFHLLLKSK